MKYIFNIINMDKNCYEMINCNVYTLFNQRNQECIKEINKQLDECKDHPNYDKLISEYIYKYRNVMFLNKK